MYLKSKIMLLEIFVISIGKKGENIFKTYTTTLAQEKQNKVFINTMLKQGEKYDTTAIYNGNTLVHSMKRRDIVIASFSYILLYKKYSAVVFFARTHSHTQCIFYNGIHWASFTLVVIATEKQTAISISFYMKNCFRFLLLIYTHRTLRTHICTSVRLAHFVKSQFTLGFCCATVKMCDTSYRQCISLSSFSAALTNACS